MYSLHVRRVKVPFIIPVKQKGGCCLCIIGMREHEMPFNLLVKDLVCKIFFMCLISTVEPMPSLPKPILWSFGRICTIWPQGNGNILSRGRWNTIRNGLIVSWCLCIHLLHVIILQKLWRSCATWSCSRWCYSTAIKVQVCWKEFEKGFVQKCLTTRSNHFIYE